MPQDVLSVSGGKDSTAMYLMAVERGRPFRAVFADVGNEHPWTLDYVASLAARTGGPPVETVKADLAPKFERKRKTIREKWPIKGVPDHVVERALSICRPTGNVFLDACILRAGFPAAKHRFCTDMLKITPIRDQVYRPVWETGRAVVSWQGVRANESPARADLPKWQRMNEPDGRLFAYRPLIDWTVEDVWRMHRRHGIEPNPLYRHGMDRVGCMPCIMGRKNDLRVIAERWPQEIDRIEEWERIVGESSRNANAVATFFSALDHGGGRGGIRDAVEWSRTMRGGRQYDLIPIDDIRVELGTSCAEWGACE